MSQHQPERWLAREHALPLGEDVLLMAILNVTPDSFSDGGLFQDHDQAIDRALEMVDEGAHILDIGGESSRPGSYPISLEEELQRVVPLVAKLVGRVPVPISVDTTKAEVARRCLDLGAAIINDISALRDDPAMAVVVKGHGAGLILMHMRGMPATMQLSPSYTDVIDDVYDFLRSRIEAAVGWGIDRERIAVDPGIGFGKRLQDNLAVLGQVSSLDRPVLEREWGTAAAVAAAVLNGAHVVRVHAVSEMKDVVRVSQAIRAAGQRLPVQ